MKKKLVRLQVFKVNSKALKIYQRLGFKVIQETDTHYRLEFTPILKAKDNTQVFPELDIDLQKTKNN